MNGSSRNEPIGTAHVDTFALEQMPPRSAQPEFRFDLPELRYPITLNVAKVLIDDAVSEGHGGRMALHSESESWSYAELLGAVDRIANVLVQEMAVVPGNRVLLRGFNGPMLVAAWLAVVKAGAIAVTTMPMLRAKELGQIASKVRIEHALCDARLVQELRQTAMATGYLTRTVTWQDGQLESLMARHSQPFRFVATRCDDICLIAFTSGTTGEPKATAHYHRDVLAMADVVGRHLVLTRPSDVYLGSPPLGFTFGLGALLVFPLRFRAAAALVEQPTPDNLLGAAERFNATCLFTAPTMYRTLAGQARGRRLLSLRRAVSAGEPLPRATEELWRGATGVPIINGIGATEMIHIFIGTLGADTPRGSLGRPLPGYTACVLDDAGRPLPTGSTGRLAVKGPTGCRYLADERQKSYVVDGWNVTGDLFRVDEHGFYWFEARTDDMIVSSGYNIAGPEVESAILEHRAVRECAVIGASDERRGQIVKAFVALHPGIESTRELAEEIQSFVKTRIAPYKYPRAIEFVKSLPKTQTGKVQRSVLRDREQTGSDDRDLRDRQ
jgi:2-aminobenzoate-CoA ligase